MRIKGRMTELTKLEGGCLCGQMRYAVSALPFAADYCHCRQCQKSTGSAVSAWMDFKSDQVTWTKSGSLQEFASSEHVRRGFCSKCGSTLSYRHLQHPDYFSLAIASLDDPDKVPPTYHIHTDSQMQWLKIDDNCQRYPQGQR